jgi:hypothetical protein
MWRDGLHRPLNLRSLRSRLLRPLHSLSKIPPPWRRPRIRHRIRHRGPQLSRSGSKALDGFSLAESERFHLHVMLA